MVTTSPSDSSSGLQWPQGQGETDPCPTAVGTQIVSCQLGGGPIRTPQSAETEAPRVCRGTIQPGQPCPATCWPWCRGPCRVGVGGVLDFSLAPDHSTTFSSAWSTADHRPGAWTDKRHRPWAGHPEAVSSTCVVSGMLPGSMPLLWATRGTGIRACGAFLCPQLLVGGSALE